ncbi:MAG: DUF58 domain-containing protein [Saprospiraceae bacterium]
MNYWPNRSLEGFIVGLHRSPFHGFSVEFAEHRLYNNGESTRNIDWKVYARTDKLFVKRFEEETNLRCHIVVDASSTMYYPWDDKNPQKHKYENKFCFAAQSAAVLMNALRRQRDAFGLTLFDDEVRFSSTAKSSTVHYRLLLSQLVDKIENPELNPLYRAICQSAPDCGKDTPSLPGGDFHRCDGASRQSR